ncbi:MAG: C69 family dipeptidase [Bacteroidaceae bacterium]|nr:C69 family dipeptidase [Bacteroidaceae bacterium]
MKKLFLTVVTLLTAITSGMACTNLIVGKAASADGSVIVSYSADSYGMYGYLCHYPAAVHAEGTWREILDWESGRYTGRIPEAAQTYNVIGNINEYQVTIAETTFGGREELVNPEGIIDYGSLIYLALQRSKTAREAIDVMTSLVEEYGYNSSGESFSIADPNEVWIMEMIGKGPGRKGAVWVAIRIPDDCIAAHANQARIRQFPLKDKQNCLYSKDVIKFAREMGYFDGKDSEFDFADAYCPADFGGLRYCDARVWSYFNMFADADMSEYLPWAMGDATATPMPLYIQPKQKVSVRDVQNAMRDHYEGTPLDITGDVGAGPWSMPYRPSPLSFKVDDKSYFNERPISTQQTAFTFVSQMRSELPNAIGGVLWFGTDDANMAVFTPVYCCTNVVPECYKREMADAVTFSEKSAFWMFNMVSNMVYPRYSALIGDLKKVQQDCEEAFAQNQATVEAKAMELYNDNPPKAVAMLTKYTDETAMSTMAAWGNLAKFLIVKHNDMVVKPEENGVFKRTETGEGVSPVRNGYPAHFNRRIAESTGDRYMMK